MHVKSTSATNVYHVVQPQRPTFSTEPSPESKPKFQIKMTLDLALLSYPSANDRIGSWKWLKGTSTKLSRVCKHSIRLPERSHGTIFLFRMYTRSGKLPSSIFGNHTSLYAPTHWRYRIMANS